MNSSSSAKLALLWICGATKRTSTAASTGSEYVVMAGALAWTEMQMAQWLEERGFTASEWLCVASTLAIITTSRMQLMQINCRNPDFSLTNKPVNVLGQRLTMKC